MRFTIKPATAKSRLNTLTTTYSVIEALAFVWTALATLVSSLLELFQ